MTEITQDTSYAIQVSGGIAVNTRSLQYRFRSVHVLTVSLQDSRRHWGRGLGLRQLALLAEAKLLHFERIVKLFCKAGTVTQYDWQVL